MAKGDKFMSLKFNLSRFIFVVLFSLSLMSSYSIFYGSVGSFMWAFLYYGKYVSGLFLIAIAIRNINFSENIIYKKILCWFNIPLVLILFYSIMVWLINSTSLIFISRGISTIVFKFIAVNAGILTVFLFRNKTINLIFSSCALVFVISFIIGIIHDGQNLINSIGNLFNTVNLYGIENYFELHELVFIVGLIIIYLIFTNYSYSNKKQMLIGSFLIFILGFKRISFIAVIIALLFSITLNKQKFYFKKTIITMAGVSLVFAPVLYIYLIKNGYLDYITQSQNINSMGRNIIWDYFSRFYEFSFTFIGKGIGFVTRQFDFTTVNDLYNMISVKALHNDFLKLYIEYGFLGFTLWLVYWVIAMPKIIIKKFDINTAAFFLIVVGYSFVTYFTDNTEDYFAFQFSLHAILTLVLTNNLYLHDSKYTR